MFWSAVGLTLAGLVLGVLIGRWLRGWVARWCRRCGGPMTCADCRRRERDEPIAWDSSTMALKAIREHLIHDSEVHRGRS